MPERSALFNAAATTAVFGTMGAAWACQDYVRAQFNPIFEAVEFSYFAYILMFVGYTAMPEPSPIVVILSALVVFSPPREMWAAMMNRLEDYQKVVWMLTSVFVVFYWTNGLLLTAMDHYGGKWLDRYRIQKVVKAHSRPAFGKLIRNLLINTCLVPVIGLVIGLSVTLKPSDFEIPGPFEMFLSTIAGVFTNEICFFYGHWLMHANKFLYGRVHKVHHEFKSPCALAAIYCHPIELVISDFLPLGSGIILFNRNLYAAACFTGFAILGTQTHHSGFRWPWIPGHANQPDFHDFHHEKFNCNYGNVGLLDDLHGTSAGSRHHPVATNGKEAAKAA